MADTTGLFSSGDYKISSMMIVTSTGQSVDVRNIMLELNIYEDIFSPVITGDITLGDAADIMSAYQIHGNEFLCVSIDKPSLNKPITKIFRIYKVGDRDFGTASLQNYTLFFASEELLLSVQTLISKSYKGLRIDQMVNDLLLNKLKVNSNKMNGIFTQSLGSFDIIIPRMNPLEAIQWLSPRAYAQNQNLFFFYENRDGFNFTSYENLLTLPTYNTYYRNVKITRDVEQNMNSFNFIRIIEDFDIIKATRMGSFSSSLAVLDLVNRSFKTYNFNATQVSSNGLLNKNIPSNNLQNRLGLTLYTANESLLKYVASGDSDPSFNPADIKNWLPQTATRLGQINTFKVVISIPGDILLKVGNVVNLIVPKMETQTQSTQNDSMRSGRYLVASVKHVFNQDNSTTVIELLSDSVNTDLLPAAQNSQTISGLIS